MSKQPVSQELFIRVKERLDYLRLSAQFPIEATPLINKLLTLVDGNAQNRQTNYVPRIQGQVDSALKFQIARVVRQNNELHLDIICLKQQVQSLEHRLYKHDSNKHSNKAQSQKYQKIKQRREEELISELREIKYKYNQLMDFLHQDPNQEREYIKRLMKHNRAKIQQHYDNKQSKQTRRHTEESAKYRINQLQQKIINRDQQIARLHKHLQYDGVNLNKLINNFNKHLVKQQLNSADNKIDYLEASFEKIKKENNKIKSSNGSKQALRAQVESCHLIIQKLKQENNQLKRNSKQQVFNLQRRTNENDLTLKNIKNQKLNSDKTNNKNELIIIDLNKKIEFLQKEVNQARKISQIAEQRAKGLQSDKGNLLRKLEQTKVFYQYQIQNTKKKVSQLEFEIRESNIKNRQMNKELDFVFKESQLKSESINNLQKIVGELINKNNLVAAQDSIKRCESLELKRRFLQVQQRLISCQNQKAQIQIKLRAVSGHFEQALKQKQRQEYVG